MRWDEVSSQECSVARASAVLGDRWTLLILSDVFLGVRRFEDFQSRLGISRTTLAERLRRLEEHGVLEKRVYQTNPPRCEYRLTPKGLDLHPLLMSMINWGDTWYAGKSGPPILRTHVSCGHDVAPVLSCPECGEVIGPHSIRARKRQPGRGLRPVERGPMPAPADRS